MLLPRAAAGLIGAASLAAAVPTIEVEGNYFVNPSTGNRFQIVGVAYQPGGSAGFSATKDPLSSPDACLRDAALMQILGVNAIRVYNLDPDLNHDECASIFNAAGMYMFLDVNSPLTGGSINSAEPWTSYYAAYLNRTFAVVEGFKNYPNTAAFFAGNEVIFDESNGATVPPYIRAVTRDLKNYISKHADRAIPVGYSAADVREILFDSWEYMQCTTDGTATDPSRVDLFALNSYSWCGDSSFTTSSYNNLVSGFSNSSVPIFFSEFGCNTPAPRVFTEVPEIYSDDMNTVFSGGIVYEYAQEANNYGLVNISDDGSAVLMADFYTLQKQYAALDFSLIQGVAPPGNSPSPPDCSATLITTDGFITNFTIPDVPPGAQDIIDNGVSPAPVGKIVDVSSYAVTVTVKDSDGNVLSNLAVTPLDDNQINSPGTNTQSAVGNGTSENSTSGNGTSETATGTSSSSASSTGAAAGTYAQGGSMSWKVVSAIILSVMASFLC